MTSAPASTAMGSTAKATAPQRSLMSAMGTRPATAHVASRKPLAAGRPWWCATSERTASVARMNVALKPAVSSKATYREAPASRAVGSAHAVSATAAPTSPNVGRSSFRTARTSTALQSARGTSSSSTCSSVTAGTRSAAAPSATTQTFARAAPARSRRARGPRWAGIHPQEDVQTTLIPSGGAAIVEFTARVPGNYTLVDHSIFRAFNKGALGTLKVTGLEDRYVYSGKQADTIPGAPIAKTDQVLATIAPPEPGKSTFSTLCASCHQADAKGIPGAFPPLAGSDFLMADKKRSINVVLHGLSGQVTVNGKSFTNMMPPQSQLSDREISDVLTYVRKSFGNHGDAVTESAVASERASKKTAPSF